MSERYDAAVKRLLRRLEDFDREAHRAIQTNHRDAYNAVLFAARQVYEAIQAEDAPRRLDGEPSPEYVTGDWPKEQVTL